jgi:predicted PurR-regulated permease PerM
MLLLGAVLIGLIMVLISWAAPVITPVIMAGYLAALFAPLYFLLQDRGVSKQGALVLLVVAIVVGAVGLAALLSYSVGQFTEGLKTYQADPESAETALQASLAAMGLDEHALRNIVDGDTVISLLLAIAGMIASFVGDLLFGVILIAFFLLEMERFETLAKTHLKERPIFGRLPEVAETAVVYFGVRTRLNVVTGLGVGVLCLLLGVDNAVLWGLLAFLLSYIPYIGLFAASIPPTILAVAEHGLGRGAAVVIGILLINLAAENILEPKMTGKALRLSPTIVILSFFLWGWLLGPTGALLSMPITVTILLVAEQSEQTRWVARIMSSGERDAPETEALDAP